jgi:hypothetical protein
MKEAREKNDTAKRVSRIRQLLYGYRKEQEAIIWELARSGAMVIGSFYQVYKTCNKPNCICKKGKRHGPYPALFMSIEGKRKLKMVRLGDVLEIAEKAKMYQRFQKGMTKIRKLNTEVDNLLEELKGYLVEEYE